MLVQKNTTDLQLNFCIRVCLVCGRKGLVTTTLLVFYSIGATAAGQSQFIFKPQQSVYVVAVRGNTGDPSLSSLDLSAENEIKDGFAKRGTFVVAASLSKADFVFLCVTEYKENVKAKVLLNIMTLVLRPTDYENYRSDIVRLRDLAVWQNTRSAKARVKLKSLMNDFHDFVGRQ